ncbi:glycosyltransferase family 1 protein [Peribacillus frigoritolerans]|uniref:glycosyltransferase family 1 protein n=1 Tax=Peribacillus frigoritolerans TaxID=450367 RepID=UPI0007BFCF11|nr:glycosyltransferase family 1 protein [Peribacillus frigoritolerans]MED4694903.1 glycosyltransferase family 1 protein [Peribacillus frigoritolerans]
MINKCIKVLQVSPSISAGGIPTLLVNWYKNVDMNNIHFDFTTFEKERTEEFYTRELKSLNSNILNVKSIGQIGKIKFVLQFIKIFRQKKYDIVHAHLNEGSIYVLFAAMICGVKVRISHSHVFIKKLDNFQKVRRLVFLILLNMFSTNQLACSSEAAKYLFGSRAYKKKQVQVIENGIVTERFIFNDSKRKELRKQMNLETKFVLGNVGRMSYEKNHSFLIDVFREVQKQNDNAVLLLIGDGELRTNLEEKVNILGLTESVIFLGNRRDISELLEIMDVFVFPSLFEGLGISVIESQASGLVTIASDVIPHEVKVTDKVNFISLEKPPVFWAQEILKYSKGYIRRSTIKELTKSGFEIRNSSKKLEDFYYNCINK